MNSNKSILGIHIDDDFLNIVHLGQSNDGLKVCNATAEPLEKGVIEDGLIIDEQTVSQKIRDFIKTNQLKTCKAIMSLSCSTVRLKPCEFEVQSDQQLQKQVEERISKYALFGGAELVFDYCVFERKGGSSGRQTVLAAVTTRQISDTGLVVAEKAGLDLVRIEPAVLPIIKLVLNKQDADSESVSLLLALASASANLSVFSNGLPQLCQNLSTGIKDLSQDKDGFTLLMEEMKPVLDFAHSLTSSQQIILRVVASCSSEKLEEIAGQIRKSLSGVEIEQTDCSQIAKRFDVRGADVCDVPIFAFACALTDFGVCEYAGQLNLISQESLAIRKTRKEMSLTAKVIAAVVLLSVAALVPLKMKIKGVEAASAGIEAKVTANAPMREKITELKKQIEPMKAKLSAYSSITQELADIPWPKALQVIGDSVPAEVRIVDISTTDSGNFTLIGEALAESWVYRFAKKLQDGDFIESAKVAEIEYDDSSDAILVDYKIACKIKMRQDDL